MQYAGRSVLVTGASGFIGSHLVRRLVQLGANVQAAVRQPSAASRLADLRPHIRVWQADVTDYGSILACFREARPEIVVHLAGDTSGRRFDGWTAVERSVAVNLHGTLKLLRGASESGAPVTMFLRAGGLEEYGTAPTPFRESEREQPVSPYSASQVATTQFCHALQPHVPFAIVTVRPALVYGPGQSTDFFIPHLIECCLDNVDFDMTAGTQMRDLLYVDDLVDALLLAAVRPNLAASIINIGSGKEHSVVAVAEQIVRLTGTRAQLRVGAKPDRAADLQHLVASTEHARAELGWLPTVTLTDGLQRTISWYRARRAATT